GLQDYAPLWQRMSEFTNGRDADTPDEAWLVEHQPVFTLGQAGRREHLLNPGDIPVVPCDRGGQVTYHGPGQLVFYPLLDLRRYDLGVRQFVQLLEEVLLRTLADYGIAAERRESAPGVYVAAAKIASLGLRIRRGCSFHGLSLNAGMDTEPFRRINPCGYAGLQVTDMRALLGPDAALDLTGVAGHLVEHFAALVGCELHWMGEATCAVQSAPAK